MDDIPSIADFRSPPVVEVVFGVQFEPLAEFRSAHVGLFWQQVRKEYPTARDVLPLAALVEDLSQPSPPVLSFLMPGANAAIARAQLVDERGGQMIQIQSGRFHYNWENQGPDDAYLRYKNIRPTFVKRWEKFKAFVAEQGLGELRPTQYELTYLNHMPPGELWDEARGVADVFPWFSPPSAFGGGIFEPQFAMRSTLPKCRGRIHVTGNIGQRQKDRAWVLALDLTVRGAPATPGADSDLVTWMDDARECIVRTFVSLTSEKARQVAWKQTL